jgi:hypothetical protein
VRLPSASLLLSRLSEFTVFRRIYSASYIWQALTGRLESWYRRCPLISLSDGMRRT